MLLASDKSEQRTSSQRGVGGVLLSSESALYIAQFTARPLSVNNPMTLSSVERARYFAQ
jgi:hypothetical protein